MLPRSNGKGVSEKPVAEVRPREILVLVIGVFAVLSVLTRSDVHEAVQSRFVLPFFLQARESMEAGPPVDPRLKIFSFDDVTAGEIGAADLSLSQWADLLEAIDAQDPEAIYIDKLFSLLPYAASSRAELTRVLEGLETEVVTAAFVSPQKIEHRKAVALDHPDYRLTNLFESRRHLLSDGPAPTITRKGWDVYGPHADFQKAFHQAGHTMDARQGRAKALIQLSHDTILPHFVFMGPHTLQVKDGELFANDVRVPLQQDGRVLVDFIGPKQFWKRNNRLLEPVRRAERGEPLESVASGDVVLILPSMFTGGTDFARTPLGAMPGGYVIASLLNSITRGEWIDTVPTGAVVLASAIGLGTLVISFSSGPLIFSLLMGSFVFLLTSFAAFVEWRTFIDPSLPMTGFVTTGIGGALLRSRVREKLVLFLRVLRTENDVLKGEIDQAGEIARVFNPRQPPDWPELNITVDHRPLMAASGDWFTFETSVSGRFRHCVMCDVTGHGVQAAIVVSTCRTVMSLMVEESPEQLEKPDFLAEFMTLLNGTLYKQGSGRHVTTLGGLTYDNAAGTLHYLCAGHPSPLFLRREDDRAVLKPLTSVHNPVGIRPHCAPKLRTQEIQMGDQVLLFTDGVPVPRKIRLVREELIQPEEPRDELTARGIFERLQALSARSRKAAPLDDDASLMLLDFSRGSRPETATTEGMAAKARAG